MGATLLAVAANATETQFTAGKLAVLRGGDGVISLALKQSPMFIDEFDATTPGNEPLFTVAIPTNGPSSFFFNGHAATEGVLSRSADQKQLVFAGYGGINLLQESGTAARLEIQHGVATVDAAGKVQTTFFKFDAASGKINARGATGDGQGNFWGCGNAGGTFFLPAGSSPMPQELVNFENCRTFRIINHTLYGSINAADGYVSEQSAGIYGFAANTLPHETNATPTLVVAAAADYKKTGGFDISPAGDVAYMADVKEGIQKYVKTGGEWKFAYNFAIPQTIPADQNTATGCFAVVADFSQTNPVVFATTTEGYNGAVNSNRVVRIVDTGEKSAVTTLVQATSTNICYRGIEFAPTN